MKFACSSVWVSDKVSLSDLNVGSRNKSEGKHDLGVAWNNWWVNGHSVDVDADGVKDLAKVRGWEGKNSGGGVKGGLDVLVVVVSGVLSLGLELGDSKLISVSVRKWSIAWVWHTVNWVESSVVDNSVGSKIIGLVVVLEPDREEGVGDVSRLDSLNEWRVSSDLRSSGGSQSKDSISGKPFNSKSKVGDLQEFHKWDGDQISFAISDNSGIFSDKSLEGSEVALVGEFLSIVVIRGRG